MMWDFDPEYEDMPDDLALLICETTSKDKLEYIKKVKMFATCCGMCRGEDEFSLGWLDKSRNYYSEITEKKEMPTDRCIRHLIWRLREEYEDDRASSDVIKRLIYEGKKLLADKKSAK
ncbi:MAG: hypothetical protein J6Y03_03545 [Alphaproteobacteria bacterium]|nr:hypothetical protein [Alphaproteobacteria bacterium]